MAKIKPSELSKTLEKRVNDAHKKTFKKWQDRAKKEIKVEMLDYISKGKSPVAKEGRYQKYSDSYKKQIKGQLSFFKMDGKTIPFKPNGPTHPQKYGKKVTPVNLSVTGKMLKSLKSRATIKGISVWFSSKIAKYHNGDGRVRRALLPKDNERFNRPIRNKLADIYIKLFKL